VKKKKTKFNLWLCTTCKHNYEDHIKGFKCSFCWADGGANSAWVCVEFKGDNLVLLEELDKEKDDNPRL
jgi:hypothetical protein